jgi:hypothetical protein
VLLRLSDLWRHGLDREATFCPPLSLSLKVTPNLISPERSLALQDLQLRLTPSLPLNARSATPLGFLFKAAGVSKFSSP